MMLTERSALVHAQSLLNRHRAAVQVLTGIQKSFDDDLFNYGWDCFGSSRRLTQCQCGLSEIVSRGVIIASVPLSYKGWLIEQSLSRIVYTDVGALKFVDIMKPGFHSSIGVLCSRS